VNCEAETTVPPWVVLSPSVTMSLFGIFSSSRLQRWP
jgi:hypothetical protein